MELISVLILTFVLGGQRHEREIEMPAATCTRAAVGISKAIAAGTGPHYESLSGRRTPIETATCLHACVTRDGLEPLDLIATEET